MLSFVEAGVLMRESTQAITANLVNKANNTSPLILYNRTRLRAEEHSVRIGHSTVVAASLEYVVTNADIIWSCVQNQEAVEQIFAEILSLTLRNLRGKLFIEAPPSLLMLRITSENKFSRQAANLSPCQVQKSIAHVGRLASIQQAKDGIV